MSTRDLAALSIQNEELQAQVDDLKRQLLRGGDEGSSMAMEDHFAAQGPELEELQDALRQAQADNEELSRELEDVGAQYRGLE